MAASRIDAAWEVLHSVPDPEVPAVSVCDLGIVRDVIEHDDGLEIVLTPTYSGCPATEAIEHDVLAAIEQAGLGRARATLRRAPAWTSDWISDEGRAKLKAYGIAPPRPTEEGGLVQLLRARTAPPCPYCDSGDTEIRSEFGPTACKSVCWCRSCGQPFEEFKAF